MKYPYNTNFRFFVVLIFVLIISNGQSIAQEKSASELAKMSQNPLANLMSFPFQNNTTFGIGDYDRSANVLNVQPVIPFYEGKLITRTIFPIVSSPVGETETISGLGDINFTAFYAPTPKNGLTWGIGPVLSIPTGSDVSTKKWSTGASFLMLKMTKKVVFGFIVNNVWSIAGDDSAADVNQMFFQYFVNYNFQKGWYLASGPIVTSNWEASDDNQWVIPFGGGGGKIVKLGGKLPLNLQAQAFYNAVKPTNGGDWSLRLQAQIMLPK